MRAGRTRAACWLVEARHGAERAACDAMTAAPLVEVRRPGDDLRRVGALAQPRARAQAAPVPACGRRRQLHHPARQDAGAGGRIGLRQEHGGAAAGRAVRADARHGASSTARTPARSVVGGQAARPAPAHADDLPGPVRQPEPALAGAATSSPSRCASTAWSATRPQLQARRRAAAVGGPGRGRHGEVPAPVLRRAAPAHLDRARAGHAARVPGLRRADLGARRVGAGAGPQPHEGPAARARA